MTVLEVFGVDKTKGEVGIEIEVEGQHLPVPGEYWRRDTDSSLRGEYSAIEYVLDKPVKREDVGKVLDYLDLCYTTCNTEVIDSVRCGVHVHINVQELTMTQLYNFMTVYLILENLLVRYCGEYREGNLFCLRSKDAEYLIYTLKQVCQTKRFNHLHTDMLRYASMNVKALGDYGSLEFRAMRGTRDMSAIKFWAETLLKVKDASLKFDTPKDILADFSGDICDIFLERVLGEDSEKYKYPDYQQALLEGVRGVQELVYTIDWDELKEWSANIKEKPSPAHIVGFDREGNAIYGERTDMPRMQLRVDTAPAVTMAAPPRPRRVRVDDGRD